MEEEIAQLKEVFQKSLPEGEEELVIGFEQYLRFAMKSIQESDSDFVKKDSSSIQKTLAFLTNSLCKADLDTKRQKLLKDESMERIQKLSNQAYEVAMKVLKGEEIEEKIDTEQVKKQLEELLNEVEYYNVEHAKQLVSEGILDLNFIENPNSSIMSLRLGREKW